MPPVTNAPLNIYTDEKGNPWIVRSDVLKVLYGNADGQGQQYERLNADEKIKVNRMPLGLPAGSP